MKRTTGIDKHLPHPAAARHAKGLTQWGLVEISGVSYATVARCERDGKYPLMAQPRAAYLRALSLKDRPLA